LRSINSKSLESAIFGSRRREAAVLAERRVLTRSTLIPGGGNARARHAVRLSVRTLRVVREPNQSQDARCQFRTSDVVGNVPQLIDQ